MTSTGRRGRDVPVPGHADPPTALFAGNNIVALGIVAELARSKRKDVAVVAFDDVALAEALEPALTVGQQRDRAGLSTCCRAIM
jgi:LacI family transcriptional regulator